MHLLPLAKDFMSQIMSSSRHLVSNSAMVNEMQARNIIRTFVSFFCIKKIII